MPGLLSRCPQQVEHILENPQTKLVVGWKDISLGVEVCHHTPKRPDICLFGVVAALKKDFRSSVLSSADFGAEALTRCAKFPRQTEVAYLDKAAFADEHIFGFDIPMEHELAMQVFQSQQDLIGDKPKVVLLSEL